MNSNRVLPFSLLSTSLLALSAFGGMELVELPTLPGAGPDSGTVATAVNDRGQVTGHAVAFYQPPWMPETHAFLYDHATGEMRDLGTLPRPPEGEGTMASFGKAINDLGWVVGDGTTNWQAPDHPVPMHAFVWSPVGGGLMRDIGTLGGVYSWANAINNSNVVVGEAQTPYWFRAFRWTETEGMVELGDPPGWYATSAADINDAGVVVGYAVLTNVPPYFWHAVMWKGTNRVDLGTLGGESSHAEAINNRGVVTGNSGVPDVPGLTRMFIWTETTGMIAVPPPPGGDYDWAYDINDAGVIVGQIGGPDVPGGRAGCWVNGTWFDLQARCLTGWSNTLAFGINNHGWIVGYGQNPEGNVRAWLLIPQPPAPGGPVITQAVMTAEGFVMRGTNGWPLAEYEVLYSTDITQPMTNWAAIATNVFDLDGAFACTNTIPDSPPQAFFRLRTAAP